VCTCQSAVTVQSGNKPMSVSSSESSLCVHVSVLSRCSLETSHCHSLCQKAACMCMSISCRATVWKQGTVSQFIREQSVCTCQCVATVQSGNKPLSVSPSKSSLSEYVSVLSWCSLETSHCQPVRQSAAFMNMSVCCHGAVWKQATAIQSVSQQPVCAYQSVVMVQS